MAQLNHLWITKKNKAFLIDIEEPIDPINKRFQEISQKSIEKERDKLFTFSCGRKRFIHELITKGFLYLMYPLKII